MKEKALGIRVYKSPPYLVRKEAILQRLYSRSDFEKRRSLGYTERSFRLQDLGILLAELGHPEKSFQCIHVAGTSGKGTTVYFISALLQYLSKLEKNRANKLKIAEYYSPHVNDERDRFMMSGIPIGWEELLPVLEEVLDTAEALEHRLAKDERYKKISPKESGFQPTVFDIFTATASLLFSRKRVDMAVFETGLGGRLDSTNIVSPLLSVLTLIDFDHEQRLGHSLKAIAFEKAGIIKPGVPVVYHAFRRNSPVFNAQNKPISYREEVETVIVAEARKRKSKCLAVHTLNAELFPISGSKNLRDSKRAEEKRASFRLPFIPHFLLENFSVAVQAIEAIGYTISTAEMADFLKMLFQEKKKLSFPSAFLQGRFQRMGNWLLDAAHNNYAFQTLLQELQRAPFFTQYKQVTVVFYAFFDKDIESMTAAVPKHWNFVFFQLELPFVPNASMMSVLKRAKQARYALGASFQEIKNLDELNSFEQQETLFLATGSFKTVAAALRYLQRKTP